MKKKSFLFATLCSAIFFAACSNEENLDSGPTGLAKNQFTIKINPGFDLVQSRIAAQGNEGNLTDTYVYLYDNSGDLMVSQQVANASSSTSVTLEIPSDKGSADDVKSVYVLSNLGESADFPLMKDAAALGTADYDQLSNLEAAYIGVKEDGYKDQNQPLLPFAGKFSVTSTDKNSIAVNLLRKVAKVIVKNELTEEVQVRFTNLSGGFDAYVADSPSYEPKSLVDLEDAAALAAAGELDLYVLPNVVAAVSNQTTITVNGTRFPIPSLEPNKVYTYKIIKTLENEIAVNVTVSTDWSTGGETTITPGTPHIIPNGFVTDPIEIAGATDFAELAIDDATNKGYLLEQVTQTRNTGVSVRLVLKRPYDRLDAQQVVIKKDADVLETIYMPAYVPSFTYEEITIGSGSNGITLMDRDLGAKDVNSPGELFIQGTLNPVDQSGVPASLYKYFTCWSDYSGNGRAIKQRGSYGTDAGKFFADGVKQAADPCPDGWHVMTRTDCDKLFTGNTLGTSLTASSQGSIGGTVTFTADSYAWTWTGEGKTIKFSSASGAIASASNWFANDNWPTAWWLSNISGGKIQKLTMGFNPTAREIQINTTADTWGSSYRGYLIRCVKDNNPAS